MRDPADPAVSDPADPASGEPALLLADTVLHSSSPSTSRLYRRAVLPATSTSWITSRT